MLMAFHSRFFPSDHEVYLGELVEARKEPDESVEKFLHRCRNKSIKCTHPLTEKESINICARLLSRWFHAIANHDLRS